MRRSIKPLVIALVCIFGVSAIITGIFFVTRGFSDIRDYGYIGGANSQPYAESWSLPFSQGQGVSVDVSEVNVNIMAHDGAAVEAAFEGTRSPDSRGELPYIEAVADGNRVVLRERYASGNTFSIGLFSSSGAIRGTLTVLIPRVHIGEFYVDAFSGSVAASDIDADRVTVSTSSGYINLANVSSYNDLSAESFSGEQILSGLTAKDITLNASSGRIGLTSLSAASLHMETFSGAMDISGATIDGEATLNASSGSITLTNVNAGSLYTEQFSGKLNLNGAQIYGAASLNTSDGAITGQNVSIQDLTFETFSGAVNIDGLTSGSILGETSSGAVDLKLESGSSADIKTFSGGVALAFPRNAGYNYALDTFSGNMTIDDGGAGNNVTEKSKDEMRGSVGGGGNAVNIETSSGAISITAQ